MSQSRKDPLENDLYYHVFNRSISKYVIFNDAEDYSRLIEIFDLYRHVNFYYQYSKFVRLEPDLQSQIIHNLQDDPDVYVDIIAFCLMPTHLHLLLQQKTDNGISIFMSKILNCYSRYFNIKHQRTGPLWCGRFKNVRVKSDEQLLHLSRYIHLNPCSINLVQNPEDWQYSSYNEYLNVTDSPLDRHKDIFSITPKEYKKFVLNHKSYQRELSIIKSLIIEDYTV